MNPQTIIIINPYCHQGMGWRRWLSIRETVINLLPGQIQEVVLEKRIQLNTRLIPLLQSPGEHLIISAGGDGSMHYLVNILMRSSSDKLNRITLGAIGLGSSNDFLKPFGEYINDIPVQMRYHGPAKLYDVGHATFLKRDNTVSERYFIVNASLGVTAAANWEFNQPGIVLKFLKKYFTEGAIIFTAVRTILNHQNIDCRIQYNGVDEIMSISNINILKKTNVSGSLKYPQEIRADDGWLGINICKNMSRVELLCTMHSLSKGEFLPNSKRISDYATTFHLSSPSPVIFECDGETEEATTVSLSILPKAIKILIQ